MGFMISGSIFQSVRMMGLSMKWQERQRTGLLKKEEENPEITALREQAHSVRESQALCSITGKLYAGGELTDEEMAYLKTKNPQAYQQALEIKRERQAYKKQLQACKTKEEVEKLNLNRMQRFLAEARAVSNNPSLSSGEKKGQLEKIMLKAIGVRAEHIRFVQTCDYARLPEDEQDKKAKRPQKKPLPEQRPVQQARLDAALIWEALRGQQEGFSPEQPAGANAPAQPARPEARVRLPRLKTQA